MRSIRLQFFFFAAALGLTASAGFAAAHSYSFAFTDVDGNKLSFTDHSITIVVVTTSKETDKARIVADRVPDYCLANPAYRMITLLRFQGKHYAPTRAVINAMVRRRLDVEAQRLRQRYVAKNIARDARKDAFAVTDFDGAAGSQLGIPAGSMAFQVLVLGRSGELLRRWTDVPTREELDAVLK